MPTSTLILGLGNILLSDEAVGAVVARRVQERWPNRPGFHYLDGGTLSFTLAEPIALAARLIVVDAARMDCTPGTVQIFEGAAMDHRLRYHGRSVHEISLADLLDMARLTDTLPMRRALVAIEPARIDWGDSLSPAVAAAVEVAAARIDELIAGWGQDDEPS
ncbi:hydrogenase maturation protease [Thioalkalicoccus limnaeus]|uniref:Hydrogenase maturation protease n=1 Tax=Thioalkalicoccus limnaeus TaxID=120681 RepID=A0ABV4BA39_9GAMM